MTVISLLLACYGNPQEHAVPFNCISNVIGNITRFFADGLLDAGRVTGLEYIVLPGVVGTVAVGVLKIEGGVHRDVVPDVVPRACDDNASSTSKPPTGGRIADLIATEPVVIPQNPHAALSETGRTYGRDHGINHVVLVSQNNDAFVAGNQNRTKGGTVREAIVVSFDDEMW